MKDAVVAAVELLLLPAAAPAAGGAGRGRRGPAGPRARRGRTPEPDARVADRVCGRARALGPLCARRPHHPPELGGNQPRVDPARAHHVFCPGAAQGQRLRKPEPLDQLRAFFPRPDLQDMAQSQDSRGAPGARGKPRGLAARASSAPGKQPKAQVLSFHLPHRVLHLSVWGANRLPAKPLRIGRHKRVVET